MEGGTFSANAMELKKEAEWLHLYTDAKKEWEIWVVAETLKNLSLVQNLTSTPFSFFGRVLSFLNLLNCHFHASVFCQIDSSKCPGTYQLIGSFN